VSNLCAGTEAVVANHNAPTQIVISGPPDAVQQVLARAEKVGGKGIPLSVSGPFHSPLMLPAQMALAPLLQALDLGTPDMHFISSVSGKAVTEVEALKELLVVQMTASVRWVDVTRELDRLEVDTAIEVGSGDVLTRLGRRSDSSIRFLTFEEAIHEEI
ncbi:ACP S-malonyltransferase, partial [Candidatus Bipolaricaulota bacterium]|nr:ACP S-malonyltransferase [Candidatus Bipolaricaulota bacterium]